MITGIMLTWFIFTAFSVMFVSYDLAKNTPAMGIMKLGWVLVTLYTGPIGLFIYLLSCREPLPGTHERFISPMWKQAVGSTIHCLAGDATGIILAAIITSFLKFSEALDIVIEYAAGFAFGLLIFQSLFMKGMMGGSYLGALKRTLLPEWLSMNAIMAGMIPGMVILMEMFTIHRGPTEPGFWWVMSMATIIGGLLAFPVNYWLVSNHLKHGMGTVRAVGRGGHSVEHELTQMQRHETHKGDGARHEVKRTSMIIVSVLTLLMLACGAIIASLL